MTRSLALVVSLSAGALVYASSDIAVAEDRQIASLLARHGVAPIEPPSTAIDLELVALDGGRVWLSSAPGWLVVTFWATWCQPCRVEMPTLAALAAALDGEPVTFLAVSVDADRAVVANFVETAGVGLPVLWDQDGRAASAYDASSIPLTFVIDPRGRVVGVSRGARDWSGLAPMFRDLVVAGADSGSPVAVAWSREQQTVSLPMRLTPPAAEVTLVDPSARAGHEFEIEVRVTWAGDFEEYTLRPPALPELAGVEQLRVSASTSTEMGSSVVAYRMALRAEHSGPLVIDPVELRYQPRFAGAPVSSLVKGVEVEVLPRRAAWGGRELLVAGSLGALAGAGLWWWRRRRRDAAAPPLSDPLAGCRRELEAARRHRHDGEGGEAAARLHAAVMELRAADLAESDPQTGSGDSGVLADDLAALRERCRFGGLRPPAEDLDRLQRRVELLVDEVSRRLPTGVPASASGMGSDARPADADPADRDRPTPRPTPRPIRRPAPRRAS